MEPPPKPVMGRLGKQVTGCHVRLTSGEMPRFERAVVPGNCLWMTLADVLCPSQALFGSYSFLCKGHDIKALHDLIQNLALSPTGYGILAKLLDLIESLPSSNRRKDTLTHRDG